MYHIACIASSQCVQNSECTSLLRATPMTTEPAVKTTEARRIVGLRPKRSQNGPATNENNHAAPTLRNVQEETVILFWTFLSRSSQKLSQHTTNVFEQLYCLLPVSISKYLHEVFESSVSQ